MATLYEENIRRLIAEKRNILRQLEANKSDQEMITRIEEEIIALERLYENYVNSMGVFRRVKNSRSKIS